MTAIYRRELNSYFKGLTGYVFAAFMLLFIGIYCAIINLKSGYAAFEYALSNASFIYIIIVPILTMRSVAEERRQRTDQLLYALPMGMSKIVAGKYLAMLTALALPLAVTAVYPLALSGFGAVNYGAAYGSLLAFFLLGAALCSIGLFISSLTESQAVAAGVCVAVMLLNYFISGLSAYLSSSAAGSAIALGIAVLLAAVVIRLLTKNGTFALGVGLLLELLLAGAYVLFRDSFSGLFPSIIKQLSVFDRFETFTNGVFDLRGIVYMATVCFVFVFFTVQALEKKRYD